MNGIARAPAALQGLLEIRGLGIVRQPHVTECRLALAVVLDEPVPRLPEPRHHAELDVPLIALDPRAPSAAQTVALALAAAQGQLDQVAGTFRA